MKNLRLDIACFRHIVLWALFFSCSAFAQVENVPLQNQVYEFLDRMNVDGLLPQYSYTMLPISRKEAGEMLRKIISKEEQLSLVDKQYLTKFRKEFSFELGEQCDDVSLFSSDRIFADKMGESFSDKEKYLYEFQDTTATMYVEFLGTIGGKSRMGIQPAHFQVEEHGGRIRGTFKNRLGYFLQATNGTVFGDRMFALTEPRLRSNYKFNELGTPYFDFTEAYVRASFDLFNVEVGREISTVGTGYSGKLLLSENAPVFDMINMNTHYKSVKFFYIQGRLENDKPYFPGLTVVEDTRETKYLALHRFQFSLYERANIGLSEMIIYQRFSPEWAYLNPFTFYKSLEHALGDRDNAFMAIDAEVFPVTGVKLYGTMLLDDIDFPKIGTGWWGDELGWQLGIFKAGVTENLDGVVEYTRIEPFVYSNRVQGNNYTHRNTSLGHHLEPNSDELFFQLNYRTSEKLRFWSSFTMERHGENVFDGNGNLIKNVGGDVLQGHRVIDANNARFLDGNLRKIFSLQLKAAYEPVNNFFITTIYELKDEHLTWPTQKINSNYLSLQVQLEY